MHLICLHSGNKTRNPSSLKARVWSYFESIKCTYLNELKVFESFKGVFESINLVQREVSSWKRARYRSARQYSRLKKLEIAQCSIYLIYSWIELIFGGIRLWIVFEFLGDFVFCIHNTLTLELEILEPGNYFKILSERYLYPLSQPLAVKITTFLYSQVTSCQAWIIMPMQCVQSSSGFFSCQ